MTNSLNKALKFAEKQSARGATAEATRTMAELSARGEALPKKTQRKTSPDKIRSGADGASRSVGEYAAKGDEGKLAAGLLGAGRNFLPSDLAKLIPAAQLALDGNWSKFLSGDADGIKAALGALSSLLPPELAQLLGKATPLLTKGLESLLKDGGLPDLSKVFSLEGLAGIAAQFLPPWAGDALAVGNQLLNGDLSLGSLAEMAAKYLPPELKAIYDAIKNLPGGWKDFLKWLFENPKELQGATGLWAARLSDIATCPGGIGPITAPCLPSVLIGGQPAARVTDIALCNGLPIDSLVQGEQSVLIGGQIATRKTDKTAHGGEIKTGFPTVHIGKKKSESSKKKRYLCIQSMGPDLGQGSFVGHSNLVLREQTDFGEVKTTYGGWGDHDVKDSEGGAKGNIAINKKEDMERNFPFAHCREINQEQYEKFMQAIEKGKDWELLGSNCSNIASDLFYETTGVRLDATSWLSLGTLDTPIALNDNILRENGGVSSNWENPVS